MLEYVLFGALGGAGLCAGFVVQRRRLRAWQKAVSTCGLQVVETSVWKQQLTARAGPLEVTIEACSRTGQSARILVRVPGAPDFSSLNIRREPLLAQEIESGDVAFDRTFFLEGPVGLVLALLDAETRRLLLRANIACRLEISTGILRTEPLPLEQIPHVLPHLLDIARRFDPSMNVPRRLAENAMRDPEAGVRLGNLFFLIRELPGAPETIEALGTARSDPSPEIRLQAARALGAEGRDILLELAEGLVDDTVSAEAVRALDRELPLERARSILHRAMARRRIQTVRACQEALGLWGEAQRLADNARHDPVAGVRLRNLLVLVREFPGEPGTLETLRLACSDPSLQVQLHAAMALGAEGRDLLIELAESLADDAVSAKAVKALDRKLPLERTKALLHHALDRSCIQTARACLESLGQKGGAEDIDLLAEVMKFAKSELAPAAALALGATGNPAAEPPLLLALQRAMPDLRVAAAHALGRAGTAAAVLPLQEAAERSPHDQELQRATHQAIAEIQARLQGAAPGQLSLAGVEAGQLSLAATETGQLSLADDAAGRLALPPEEPG